MSRNKYHAVATMVDGFRFDSQAEARRYGELKLLVRAREITDLEVHPKFPLMVNDAKICTYIADFRYRDTRGTTHVEDVKGRKTALYSLKKKLVRACCGIEIEELK